MSEEIQERIRVEKGRAELESKFREAQKMEAIGRLAGGIAHDFNNLLMGIQGNVSLMQLNRRAPHSSIEKLKNIEKYVIRGSDLTKQLLGFARRGKYQVNATNLNALIAESVTLFGRTNKEVAIRLELDSKLCLVEIDRGQIEQVLLNLLMNAWQAMPGGGELVIKTENRRLDRHGLKRRDAKAGTFVVVSVIDQGIGMDEATMQKIFDPFFTTKEIGRGTGMGLASAYGIIQNHGGFFEVSSHVGKGSTFSFFLPGAFSAEPALEKNDQRRLVNGRERILLVDDEEMVTDVASQMLATLGYTVQSASSGRDALELYAAEGSQVDLVILDLIMPGMSGYKTFDRLKQMNPDVKVLLSSGYSLPEEANAIIEQGNSGFIQKPYNINDLSQKVREVLQ